ncbi:MAG TPA: hypothetical protein VFG07_07420 [Thermoplasmata archaeon]|nr:hypothetical protein [Thermoplasmata archaeon]
MYRVREEGWLDAAENLRRDEALLAQGSPAARVARLRGPVVSLGVAQPAGSLVYGRAEREGLPLVRRRSGGTGLLHLEGDLVWSVVLPRPDPRVGRDYSRAYARLGDPLVTTLRGFRIAAAWSPPIGVSTEFCLLAPRGQALCVGERVLGGAAQHVTHRALLHHGTLSVRVDRPRLSTLFAVAPSILERHVTALSELSGAPEAEVVATTLRANLESWLGPP